MKNNLKNLLHIFIFIALLFIVLNKTTKIFEAKYSNMKYGSFFNSDRNFDVLFFGSSHMINGVYPMELYSDYGIMAYNMANHGSWPAVTYYTLKNSLDYTKPKLVVVDAFLFLHDGKSAGTVSVHKALDAFPISVTKFKSVTDLLEKKEEQVEILASLSLYHTRWNELTKTDFMSDPFDAEVKNIYMGAEPRPYVCHDIITPEITDVITDTSFERHAGAEYIQKIIELCNAENIDLLLIDLPCAENNSQYIREFFKRNDYVNINYIDMQSEGIVNYDYDFSDADGHLNPSGAQKITHWLADYIIENYNIECKGEKVNDSLKNEYIIQKINDINTQTEIEKYLILLADKDLKVVINIKSTVDIKKYAFVYALIENIPEVVINNVTVSEEFSDIDITVQRADTGETVSQTGFNILYEENIIKR